MQRAVDVEHVQLELAAQCPGGSEQQLTEQQLECFVLAAVPLTPLLSALSSPPLPPPLLPFLVFTAVRRFLFFLDPQR